MEAKADHAGQDVTLAIIAGGGGHRLGGVAKGLLTLEGRPLIERILDLRPRFSEVLLVADNPGAYKAYGLRSVPDLVEGRGAPGGVHAALGTWCASCSRRLRRTSIWSVSRSIDASSRCSRCTAPAWPSPGGRAWPKTHHLEAFSPDFERGCCPSCGFRKSIRTSGPW